MKKMFIAGISSLILLSTSLYAITGKHTSIGGIDGTDNGEICVYCHTPHGANGDADGPAPLWNKESSTLTFQMYGATSAGVAGRTLAGTYTSAQPENQTLACLGCHDGVSAMNSVINAPGSGFVGQSHLVDGQNIIGQDSPTVMPNTQVMAIGGTIAIGWDAGSESVIYSTSGALQNDHPMSIEYIPGRGSLKATTTDLTGFWKADKISNLLRNGKVHCTSCHDPHGTGNSLYLRSNNEGSNLCFGCHDK